MTFKQYILNYHEDPDSLLEPYLHHPEKLKELFRIADRFGQDKYTEGIEDCYIQNHANYD